MRFKTNVRAIRAEAVDKGNIVDMSSMAEECGFVLPVSFTKACWQHVVEKSTSPTHEKTMAREILTSLHAKIMEMERRSHFGGTEHLFPVICFSATLPTDTEIMDVVQLKASLGCNRRLQPMITILLPREA